jgi:hypothetical protein
LNLILGAEGVVGVGVFNGGGELTIAAVAAADVGIESGSSESEIGRGIGFDATGG